MMMSSNEEVERGILANFLKIGNIQHFLLVFGYAIKRQQVNGCPQVMR
jgi:hypothetical protein